MCAIIIRVIASTTYFNLLCKSTSKTSLSIMATRFIELDYFNVGESLKCVYKAPGKGRCSINLKTASGDVAFHHGVRYDGNSRNVLVLNTWCGGSWGIEERPKGFDFTDGISVEVVIIACENGFDTYCNDKFMTTYKYRHGLTAASVKKIEWIPEMDVKCHKFEITYN